MRSLPAHHGRDFLFFSFCFLFSHFPLRYLDGGLATGISCVSKLPLQEGVALSLGLALAGGSDSPFPDTGVFIADITAGRCVSGSRQPWLRTRVLAQHSSRAAGLCLSLSRRRR